ncbi:hypothetical protein HPB48_003705 [Haemaphysalis longicornis]|uniref:Gag-like protein n=1 Tax=Haemaphysalis longicornis TaxID=44386 RepID=A0A9J6F7E3_HAELO|nr:hypothetical protein HPB48_003705 [Haemaphysalis longicornis]
MMEVEPADTPPGNPPSDSATPRKRICLPSEAGSEDTDLYSAPSDDSTDDDFEFVLRKKAKRRLRAAASRSTGASSTSSATTVTTPARPPVHTFLFVPESPNDNLRMLNRQAISVSLEAILPGKIKEVRINTRKNILAIDVEHSAAVETLHQLTVVGEMKVRAYISAGQGASVDVVYDVDVSIPDADLPILIKPATEATTIKQVTRLGKSRCVKLVFQGDRIPAHVKVGHFRHAVRPFVPKPLQCHKCLKIGHVSSVCGRATLSSKCSGPHDAKACTVDILKYANRQGAHDASSETCPRLKEEQKVLKQMVKDHSSHKDASAKVRRRRRSGRRRSSSAAVTKDGHDLSREDPPVSQVLPPPPPQSLPPPASPPPVEPTSCLATASTGKANKTGKSSPRGKDFPRLPSLSPAETRREDAKPHQTPNAFRRKKICKSFQC